MGCGAWAHGRRGLVLRAVAVRDSVVDAPDLAVDHAAEPHDADPRLRDVHHQRDVPHQALRALLVDDLVLRDLEVLRQLDLRAPLQDLVP